MSPHEHDRRLLADLARTAMFERGLEPDFAPGSEAQLGRIGGPADERGAAIRDLTGLAWCSIDNDDSRDLDQLSVWRPLPGGLEAILVAIADVDACVEQGSPIDDRALTNTTSVYTSARIFPMLPEPLSTDWTSLNPQVERLAVVTEMVFDAEGHLRRASVERARVFNHAKLAYDSVAAWLDGEGELPAAATAVRGMDDQLRRQDALAQRLRARRREAGALEFQSFQPKAVFEGEEVVAIVQQPPNRARQLIEEFMVATNGVTARFLAERGRASIRRIVRSPERWQRIAEVAAEHGWELPGQPDAAALQAFLAEMRRRDPLRFPDLSLVVIKLMGSGEYVVERPGAPGAGHFGLAVRDYSHSTAPNRRFPDLVTQRLVKAALGGREPGYTIEQLDGIAAQCTKQEDAANKVERQMRKSEAALMLRRHLGEVFDGVVTGSANGKSWVRIFAPPAEGMLRTRERVKVGQRLRVRLVETDVERGHIDFDRAD